MLINLFWVRTVVCIASGVVGHKKLAVSQSCIFFDKTAANFLSNNGYYYGRLKFKFCSEFLQNVAFLAPNFVVLEENFPTG